MTEICLVSFLGKETSLGHRRVKHSYSPSYIIYLWRMLKACYVILRVVPGCCPGPQGTMSPSIYAQV